MGFEVVHVANKELETKINTIQSTEIAMPTDLQYHNLDQSNPLPVMASKSIHSKSLGTNISVGSGARFVSELIEARGNYVDVALLMTTTNVEDISNYEVLYAPFGFNYQESQTGPEKVLGTRSGLGASSFSPVSPTRIVAPFYKIIVRNTGANTSNIRMISVTEHLGGI